MVGLVYFVHQPVLVLEIDQAIVSFQLSPFQENMVLPWLSKFQDVHPFVPDLYFPGPISPLWDSTFESEVAERMIVNLNRKSLDPRLNRWTLGNRPALEDAI